MDVIEVVRKDHDRVEELFSRYHGGGGITGLVKGITGNVPAKQRRAAVEGLCRELDLHARLEEEILYPAARATGDGQLVRLIDESRREHARLKETVRELRGRSGEAESLENEVNALQEQVEHHVSEEEGEMLPLLEQVMAAERRAELGRRFQAGKRQPGGRRAQRATARRGRAARAGGRRRTARATKGARQKKRARGRRKAQRK